MKEVIKKDIYNIYTTSLSKNPILTKFCKNIFLKKLNTLKRRLQQIILIFKYI